MMEEKLKLYDGRPADETGRLKRERDVYDLLEQLEIPFQRVDPVSYTHLDVYKRQ